METTTSQQNEDENFCSEISNAYTGAIIAFFIIYCVSTAIYGAILIVSVVFGYRLQKLVPKGEANRKVIIPALLKVVGYSDAIEARVQNTMEGMAILPSHVFSFLETFTKERRRNWTLSICSFCVFCFCIISITFQIIRWNDGLQSNCNLALALYAFFCLLICICSFFVLSRYSKKYRRILEWLQRLNRHKMDSDQIAGLCEEIIEDRNKKAFPIDGFYKQYLSLGEGGFGRVHSYHLSDDSIRESCEEKGIHSKSLIDYVIVLLKAQCENAVAVKEITNR